MIRREALKKSSRCEQCLERLKKGQRPILLGFSASRGQTYLCSKRCVDAFNNNSGFGIVR